MTIPRSATFALLILFAVLVIFASLLVGSITFTPGQVLDVLIQPTPGLVHDVVWQLRMPRVFAAFACGALLGLSGAMLQALLRNPLADPYILGISGGAACGALLAILVGLGFAFSNLAALAGAVVAVLIIFGFNFSTGQWNVFRLLLSGVVLSAGFSALISLILVLAPQVALKGMLFWLVGDLSNASNVGWAWVVLAIVTALSILFASSLNVISLGQYKARSLGVPVATLEKLIYFCAAAATMAAVTLGGTIGFIGLITPHAIRLLGINDYRWLLPMTTLLGGGILTLADTLARTIWAPQQLPVGILTALIGVPSMLFLLWGKR